MRVQWSRRKEVTLFVAETAIRLSVLIRRVVSENLAYVVWQGNTSPFSYTIMQAHSNLDTMITRDASSTNKQTTITTTQETYVENYVL